MKIKKASKSFRIFNGYVRNPGQMIVMVVMVGVFLLLTTIVVTFFYWHSKDIPNLIQNEVIIEKMQNEDKIISFITTKGNYSINSMLVCNYSSLEKAVQNKEMVSILSRPHWGLKGKEHEILWGIQGANGEVYLNPETVKIHRLNELRGIMYSAWGLVISYIIFSFCGWYFLSNGPRYPRIASLFVKKDWRNF